MTASFSLYHPLSNKISFWSGTAISFKRYMEKNSKREAKRKKMMTSFWIVYSPTNKITYWAKDTLKETPRARQRQGRWLPPVQDWRWSLYWTSRSSTPRSGLHCLENGLWISLDFSKNDMIYADLARWPKPYHIHRGGQQRSGWGRGRCWRPTISWRQPRGPSCKISPARNWLNDTYDNIGS